LNGSLFLQKRGRERRSWWRVDFWRGRCKRGEGVSKREWFKRKRKNPKTWMVNKQRRVAASVKRCGERRIDSRDRPQKSLKQGRKGHVREITFSRGGKKVNDSSSRRRKKRSKEGRRQSDEARNRGKNFVKEHDGVTGLGAHSTIARSKVGGGSRDARARMKKKEKRNRLQERKCFLTTKTLRRKLGKEAGKILGGEGKPC